MTKQAQLQVQAKAQTKAKTVAAVKDFYKIVGELPIPQFFPRKSLGKYIEDFIPKCRVNATRLNRDGKIDLTKIDTLEEYIEKLNSSLWFDSDIATAIIDGANFWAEKQSKYSFMEVVLIEMASISLLGCTVLYKRDMEPQLNTEIVTTTITTGCYVTPKCIKKR